MMFRCLGFVAMLVSVSWLPVAPPPNAEFSPTPGIAQAASSKRGLRIFNAKCGSCHFVVIYGKRFGARQAPQPGETLFDKARMKQLLIGEAGAPPAPVDLTPWARSHTPRQVRRWLKAPPPVGGKAHFPKHVKRFQRQKDFAAFFWRAVKK